MGKRNYSHWLRGYAEYTQHSEAPDLFHFWTGVSVIAGALRRQVWIDQRYFQWTPNFYIIFVAPPGIATKSTSISIGHNLLAKVEGVKFGPQSMTWQALTQSLAGAKIMVPFREDLLPMSCITCAVSELGTFLRPDDKDLIDVLVSLWDGQLGTWRRSTKTQGDDEIENPWINVIGCTTPSWLKDNFPEAMVGGGLTSRVVFVYADAKRKLVPYPADLIPDQYFEDESRMLMEDLQRIGEMCGEYEMEKEAKQWGADWYKDHWSKKPENLAADRFAGYMARKQTHIHKLAIVLAAAQRDDLVITRNDLEMAHSFVTATEADMSTVFESIGVAPMAKAALEVLALIRAYETVEQTVLFRRVMNSMSLEEFMKATDAVIKSGYAEQKYSNGKKYLIATDVES